MRVEKVYLIPQPSIRQLMLTTADKISVTGVCVAIVAAIAAIVVVPEVRSVLGLKDPQQTAEKSERPATPSKPQEQSSLESGSVQVTWSAKPKPPQPDNAMSLWQMTSEVLEGNDSKHAQLNAIERILRTGRIEILNKERQISEDYGSTLNRIAAEYLRLCRILDVRSAFSWKSAFETESIDNAVAENYINSLQQDSLKRDYFIANGLHPDSWKPLNIRLRVAELNDVIWNISLQKQTVGPFLRTFPIESRSPEAYRHLWTRLKPTVQAHLSKANYRKSGMAQIVESLLASRRKLKSVDATAIFQSDKYFVHIDINSPTAQAIGLNESKSFLKWQSGTEYWPEYFATWTYGFWFRRYLERSDDEVEKILLEIQRMYK